MLKASQAPTISERQAIERKVAALGNSLALVDVDRVAGAVSRLLVCFPSAATDEESAGMRAKGFLVALDDVPPWAVERACRAWLRGEVDGGTPKFAPSPPELRKVALQQMAPVFREKRSWERVLAAEIEPEYSAEEREAQKQRVERLGRILAGAETYDPKAGRS